MAALAAAPAAALGQPALLYSDPPPGDVTHGPPAFVRLRFSRPMRLDRLQVVDSSGAASTARLNRDAAIPAIEQRGAIPRLPLGEYRAEWAASAPNGDAINGSFTFRIGEPPPR